MDLTLFMKDFKLKILHTNVVCEWGIPTTPLICYRTPIVLDVATETNYTRESSRKPKSTKKLLAKLILALFEVNLSN